MQPLERGQLTVMRVHSALGGLVIVAAALAADMIFDELLGLPAWLIAGCALLVLFYPVLIGPGRRYRAWGYRFDEDELRIARGVLTRTETLVPLGRVQHIDVSQGPLERACGVCRLVLHTAGTQHSRVVLPGLSRDTAEAMRDDIRARIRREPA